MNEKKITESARGEECSEIDELWLPVIGYEGYYEVSNLGSVRSLSKVVNCNNNGGVRRVFGKLLRSSIKGNYKSVVICKGSSERTVNIHRLVAESFIPGSGAVVRHLDGNPLNNAAENLAWGSHKDNEADKARHGRVPKGESHHNSILNEKIVLEIRRLHSIGHTQMNISRYLGINRGTIGNVIRGKTWTKQS